MFSLKKLIIGSIATAAIAFSSLALPMAGVAHADGPCSPLLKHCYKLNARAFDLRNVEVQRTTPTYTLNLRVATTFQNNSSYPLLNLEVDGQPQLTSDLQPGQSIQLGLTSGTHRIHAAAYAPWQGVTVYVWDYDIQAGNQVQFTDPSITAVLSDYRASATWVGYYYDNNFQAVPIRFEFRNNGTFDVYHDNAFWASGTYHQLSMNTFDISRQFRIVVPGDPGNDGYLYETQLRFVMNIGPNGSLVEFFLQ